MTIRPAVGSLMVAGMLAACGGRSSLLLVNESSAPLVLRIEVERNVTFGYALPPHTVGWGWSDQAGSINGWVLVTAQDCTPIARLRLNPSGGSVTIDMQGDATLADVHPSFAEHDAYLSYTSACLEAR